MSNYNYLKIDFYGQFNADTIHKLTYPEPYNPNQGSAMMWLNPIKDPRNMRTLFPLAQYGYKLHRDSNGTYYSLLTKYDQDAREGYVVITVMIGHQYEGQISGKTILNLLSTLKTKMLDTNIFSQAAVEQCLMECQMPVLNASPMRIMQVSNIPSSALRTYATNEELADIFLFPNQPEYSRFGDVFVINKAWCVNGVPAGVSLLSSPLLRSYHVVKPANVQCDATTQTGKTLMITYTKPGFAPLNIPVTINGMSNQYLQYEGSKITVLEPANLPFKQRVSVVVRVNGRPYSDSKVNATIGNEPLHYNSQTGAYTAEVSQAALAGADVRLNINVNDSSLVSKSQAMAAAAYQQRSSKRYDDYDDDERSSNKWMTPLIAFLSGMLLFGAGYFIYDWLTGKGDTAPIPEPIPKTEDYEAKDIEYLKSSDTWDLTQIKTATYKELFNSIANGNVDQFMTLAQGYIAKGNPNGHIKKVYSLLEQNPKLQDEAKGLFLSAVNGDKIDIALLRSNVLSRASSGNEPDTYNSGYGGATNGGGNATQGGQRPSGAASQGGVSRPSGGGTAQGGGSRPTGGGAAGQGGSRPIGGNATGQGGSRPGGGSASQNSSNGNGTNSRRTMTNKPRG
ncbi:MAG: hypothetical protein IJ925_07585 [Muribaculaceae bacterium]|nr:hypothetical protein [Muribaculaceae bacterium]